ncbi:MAG: DUF4340 domain-containing protein [Candidatus Eiseniibacteriota bacterium]|jgi:hypothetical protein
MTGTQIRNYAAVLIALAVLVLLLNNPFGGSQEGPTARPVFPQFDAGTADRIRVESVEDTVELARRAPGDWVIDRSYPLPADTSFIRRAVESITDFTTANRVARNPDKHGIFEVDSLGAHVEVYDGGDAPVADFILGKNSSSSSGTYYRETGKDDVYLSERPVKSYFVKQERSWQDRRIFNVDPEEFTQLTVEHGDSTIVFESDTDGNWSLLEPETFPVDKEEVSALLRRVGRLFAQSLVDSAVTDAMTGLDTPMLRVRAERLDGSGIELLVGDQDEDGYYFARNPDREWVYKIAKYIVDPFYKDPTEMKREEPPAPETTGEGAGTEPGAAVPPVPPAGGGG